MRLQDFIDHLIDAGWSATSDAQWKGIAALHKKLFPVIAQLEDELNDANGDIANLQELL